MIHLLGYCDLNEEKGTFIGELIKICKFTGLKNIKNKNILGMEVVLEIV